jgi:hypothetical protein
VSPKSEIEINRYAESLFIILRLTAEVKVKKTLTSKINDINSVPSNCKDTVNRAMNNAIKI